MPRQSILHNRLLSRLPTEAFAAVAGQLEPFACPRGMIIAQANEPIAFAYFLESGIVSVVAKSPDGLKAEAGIIGREGFVHPALVLETDRLPHMLQTQLAGNAHRIAVADLTRAVEESAPLRRTLLLFAQANAVQGSFTILSNAVHHVEERLARWLLMCHDRSDSDDVPLTHEFMGVMLAVRRVSVTNAMHVLEGNGFIELARGYVVIRNRAALEEFAGDAYGKAEAEYRRLLGPL